MYTQRISFSFILGPFWTHFFLPQDMKYAQTPRGTKNKHAQDDWNMCC